MRREGCKPRNMTVFVYLTVTVIHLCVFLWRDVQYLACFSSLLLKCHFILEDSGIAAGWSLAEGITVRFGKPGGWGIVLIRSKFIRIEFSVCLQDQTLPLTLTIGI